MTQPMIQQTYDLAVRHHQAGRLKEAAQLYQQIVTQQPDHADALHMLGVAAHQMGRSDLAVKLIRRAVALKPNHHEAYYNLGHALKVLGNLDEAIAAYRQAVAIKPDFSEAYNNLGAALKVKGELDGAIAAYRQAIILKPDCAEAQTNLGLALKEKGCWDEAIAACRQALALQPNYAEGHKNLGDVLKDQGQMDAAIAAYRRAIALKPGYSAAHSNLVLYLHCQATADAAAIARELRGWNQQHAEPLRKFIQPHTNDHDPERRLRIGYVSADFCAHVCSLFLVPLLEHHNPSQVELFGYAEVRRPDAITRRLQPRFAQWRSTVGIDDEQVARQIRQDRIDVLVDLKLHTSDNRLLVFAHKPAPVQVTWLGYPGSTGLTTIDYRLSDPYLDPPGMDESIYSEQTIRLPDSFWCYDPLDAGNIPVNSLPVLATNVMTFGCLNNFSKINDGALALWAGVLRAVRNSRLLLLAPAGDHRQRILDQLSREGIDSGRVEFMPRQSVGGYLGLYHRVDLSLDSFPYNGHTTSLDSLWMGVPVVTLVGQMAVSRAGWSQLSNLGLAELAAQTPEQFVRIAVDLAQDLPRLQELRSTLRQRMQASPLMDAPRFARNIEAAYRQMWHKWASASSVEVCAT